MSFSAGKVTISPSKIKTYQECQAKYYFEYIYKSLKSPVPADVFGPGNVIHKLADKYVSFKYYKKEQTKTEEDYTLEYLMNNQKLDNSFRPRIETEYKRIKDFIKKFAFNEEVEELLPEKKINIQYRGLYFFFGYIDLQIKYKDGRILIIDYKSSEEKSNHDIQLGIYAYSIAKQNKIPISKILTGVYYSQFDVFEQQEWSKDKLKDVIREVEKVLRDIEKTNEFKKCPNQYCSNCSHRDTCAKWPSNVIKL